MLSFSWKKESEGLQTALQVNKLNVYSLVLTWVVDARAASAIRPL